jgi:hypothetical protein
MVFLFNGYTEIPKAKIKGIKGRLFLFLAPIFFLLA